MELSNEQMYAYEKWREGHNIFITGPGGCGKTHLIKYIYDTQLRHSVVCAMTGCAAVLLDCNDSTLHSWSGIRLGKESPEMLLHRIKKKPHLKKRWTKVECLIVDEVSMLSKPMLETLDFLGRHLRKCLQKPFGGIQVVFSGDFFQLPPVNETEFCFESPLWSKMFAHDCQIEFQSIFRQKESQFQQILNQIRKGSLDKKGTTILRRYMNRTSIEGKEPTKLFPVRYKVDKMNESMFNTLQETPVQFSIWKRSDMTVYVENNKDIPPEILRKCKKLSKAQIEHETENLITTNQVSSFSLKKGTFVMCTKNLNVEEGICNGSQGKIIEFQNGKPLVEFANGVQMVIPLKYYQSEDYPTIAVAQYPIIYAWATTIHKIQGATLDCAEIDIGSNVFTPGQSYVALSRLKSFDGLFLKNFSKENISAHPRVVKFYENLHDRRKLFLK